MRSWLVSALAQKASKGALAVDSVERLTRGDWLVWEPGTWRPSRANAQTVMGLPAIAKSVSAASPQTAAAEALAIALEASPDRREVSLGREKCDLVIDDRTLSQKHLVFSFDDHHWWVRDVGSRNGTLLDGRKLGGEPVRLVAGAMIQPAQVVLTYYTTASLLVRLGARRP